MILHGTVQQTPAVGATSHVDMPFDELTGDRADLLALACGRALGGFLALPGSAHPGDLHVPALLLEAGADWTTIAAHADEARRAAGGHHSSATTGGTPNGRAWP